MVTTAAKAADTYRTRIYDLSPFLLQNVPAEKSIASKNSRVKAIHVKHPQEEDSEDPIEEKAKKTRRKSAKNQRGRMNCKQHSASKQNRTPEKSVDHSGLLELIQTQLSPPCSWENIDGGPGVISLHGQYAFIRQTNAGHEMIESLLANLQKAIDERGPLKQTNFDRFREATTSPETIHAPAGGGGGTGMF